MNNADSYSELQEAASKVPVIRCRVSYEQALVSLKLKKSVDAEGGRTLAVIIEGG